MILELTEQNLIDRHSKRLLSALRVVSNCYNIDKSDATIVYNNACLFLYCILFVLYAEQLEIAHDKKLLVFLESLSPANKASDSILSRELTGILTDQFINITKKPVFSGLNFNIDDFKFSLNDLLNFSDYVLLDDKGKKINFGDLKLEFLNYLYEMFLQYSLEKADTTLQVVHKTSQETYKEHEASAYTQLKLGFDVTDELVYAGQWVIIKGCRKNKQCQGAFYTPPKIVDYITEKTFIHFESVKGLKIIDPACGCGSFLLSTYYYLAEKGISPADIIDNYIYGVDIEPIPVEISKLLLTLASGSYSENIFCQDALIKDQLPFEKNSFDLVIGNPPYLNIERIDKEKKSYYLNHFESAIRRFDLYIIFIEHAITTLLNDRGVLGFIIPDKLLTQSYAKNIRQIILDRCCISQIVELKFNNLFKGANVVPIILICRKPMTEGNNFLITQLKPDKNCSSSLCQEEYRKTFNFIFRLGLDESKKQIIDYIQSKSRPVARVCYCSWGLQPGNTKKFIFNECETSKYEMYKDHPTLRNLIRGSNVDSFFVNYTNDKVLYIIEGDDKLHRPAFPELFETDKIVIPEVSGSRGLIASLDTQHYYTNHSVINVIMKRDLLRVDKKVLKARGITLELTKSNHEPDLWQIDKGAYTRTTLVYRTDRDSLINIRYILALMNSRLIRYYFNNFLTGELNVFPELVKRLPYYDIPIDTDTYTVPDYQNLPLVEDVSGLNEVEIHDLLVKITFEIAQTPPHKRLALFDLINKAVYKLYDLSESFIEAVEADFN